MLMMIRCVVGVVWRTAWEGSELNMCEVNWTENRREWNSILKRELSWAFISVSINVSSRLFTRWKRSQLCVHLRTTHTPQYCSDTYKMKCIQRYILHFHMWCCCKIFNFCWDHMDVLLNEFLKGNVYELENAFLEFIFKKSLDFLIPI